MSVGCFGNSLEDRARECELNRYLDSQEAWSEDDKRHAESELYDDIRFNGVAWDENLVSYRLDMMVEWEEIMMSNQPTWEKMADMNDCMDRYIKLYCRDEVETDPDAYCEKYCQKEIDYE